MELRPGLHRIDTRMNTRLLSVYLLVGRESSLLFDTGVEGTVTDHVVPYLDRIGVPTDAVRTVVVSHCDADHFGGIVETRRTFTSARVVAHALDAEAISDRSVYDAVRARPFRAGYGYDPDPGGVRLRDQSVPQGQVDIRLTDGAVVDLGDRRVEVVHAPGHSAGHLVVRDLDNDAVVIADAVLGDAIPNADGTAAFAPTYRFVDSYLATIDRLQGYRPALLLTAHYPTYEGREVTDFLRRSKEFVRRLDIEVFRRIRKRPHTLTELMAQLNPVMGSWPSEGTAPAMAYPLAGHLERMVSAGVAREVSGGGAPAFVSA